MELYCRVADLGYSHAHFCIGVGYDYCHGEIIRRPSFTLRPRLWQDMMGQDTTLEAWRVILETRNGIYVMIAAAAGCYCAMNPLNTLFEEGSVSRDLIDSTLKACTISFAEMRSESRGCLYVSLAKWIDPSNLP